MWTCSFTTTFLLSFVAAASAQSLGERCSKLPNQPGTCIPIGDCPPLLALLEPSRQNLTALHQARCGFVGNIPVVCCPDQAPTKPTDGGNGNVLSTPPDIKDVSQHRNLRLLPMDTCGPVAEVRIVGGNETDLLEYPWMALIGYHSRGSILYRCGGSLINEKYVLTAAHCVTNLPSYFKLATVRLGEHDLNKDIDCNLENTYCAPQPVNFDIEKAIPHQQYSKSLMKNDIALIRLRGTVDLTDVVHPMCLPVGFENQNRLLETKVIVAGWGTTELGTSSSVQLKVALPIVPNDKCRVIYQSSVQIDSSQMCAGGEKGRDSCAGDSGGPLFFIGSVNDEEKMIQYGIVSFGPRSCGTQGTPGVYTRVGYFMDWILNNMRP